MSIRVLVADDQDLVRTGLAMILEAQPGIEVVGQAADGREAVELARRLRPDVCLFDIRMPGMDGIAATRELAGAGVVDPMAIVVITTFDVDEYVYAALRAGASGFLLKDTPPADLLTAISVVAAGEALLSPTVTRRLIAEFVSRPEPAAKSAALDGITDRERDVLVLIARGLSNAEICAHLHVGLATVKTHIGRLLSKLAARDRAQLVIAAYESGLVTPS